MSEPGSTEAREGAMSEGLAQSAASHADGARGAGVPSKPNGSTRAVRGMHWGTRVPCDVRGGMHWGLDMGMLGMR